MTAKVNVRLLPKSLRLETAVVSVTARSTKNLLGPESAEVTVQWEKTVGKTVEIKQSGSPTAFLVVAAVVGVISAVAAAGVAFFLKGRVSNSGTSATFTKDNATYGLEVPEDAGGEYDSLAMVN